MSPTLSRLAILVASLSLALPVTAQVAATGSVAGKVTDAATGRAIPDVQVRIVGTTRGVATAADGSYRLTGVAAGAVTVRAQRLGYLALNKTGSVDAGGTFTADFAMTAGVTQIDQVVITGTGEAQRKRERGTSTSTIDSTAFNPSSVRTLSNILQARSPGVVVTSSGGTQGTGSRIRIRGSNSLSLGNDPLIILDGVLLDNSTGSFSIGLGGQTISRFDDINPDDIENIEIVKGPAATALYGTAAANGVIQITSKRGRAGKAKWNTWFENGSESQIADFPANYATIGSRVSDGTRTAGCTIDLQGRGVCVPNPDSTVSWNPLKELSPFRAGRRNTQGLSVAGGNEYANYYLSGEYELTRGIVDMNNQQRVNLRSNVTARPTDKLQLAATLGYTRGYLQLPYNDNSAFGTVSQGLLGKAFDCSPTTRATTPSCGQDSLSRGYFNANVRPEDFFIVTNQQDISRFVTGITADWTPLPWLKGVARAGMDLLARYDQQLTPPNQLRFSAATLEGNRFQNRAEIINYSLNATMTATFTPMENVTSNTSVGLQYLDNKFFSTTASGAILLPGTASLNGASARFAVGETNQRVRTIGGYFEQRFGWRDVLFGTLGLRADDNSAFGPEAAVVSYPSASLSYVITEEDWFPQYAFLDQLRLRTAYGRSGQRPGFRQAFTTLAPVSVRTESVERVAVTLNTTGNEDLRPEITSEIEGGFEATMFRGKLGVDLTVFAKKTNDLLVARTLAPSLGATGTVFANLSEMTNTGIELLLTGTLYDSPDFTWQGSISATGLSNELVALGEGISPIIFGFNSTQRHLGGYPAGSYWQRSYTYDDINADGIISRVNCPTIGGTANPQVVGGPACEVALSDSLEYRGSPIPTREFNLQQTFTVKKNIALNVMFQHRGGQKLFNSTREFRCSFNTCQELNDRSSTLEEQARGISRFMGTADGYIEDASFTRLSELSLTLTAPRSWVTRWGMGAENASLTIGGRNLALWTNYSGFDPEVNANNGANFTTSDFLTQPPTRQWTTRVSINF